MLNQVQFREKLNELISHRVSLEDFEDWFRDNTRNFHTWSDSFLIDLVFAIEAVFSEYHFDDLAEEETEKRLENTLRRFDRSAASVFRVERKAPGQAAQAQSTLQGRQIAGIRL
jgi:hypothetical protein